MGWFDEQIKQRTKNDNDAFSSAFADMAGAVLGKKALDGDFCDETKRAKDAVGDILKYYHVPVQELPVNIKDINDVLEYLLRPSGIMRRSITLSDEWYKDGIGALLCTTKDGTITALLPKGTSGYTFFDKTLGKTVSVNKKNAAMFNTEALCFYKPSASVYFSLFVFIRLYCDRCGHLSRNAHRTVCRLCEQHHLLQCRLFG